MARLKKYSNETIIEAARKMFLEKGPGASTLDIAKEAGVSEGLLFKRFGTKQKLFVEAMGIPEIVPEKMFGERLGKGDMRENLTKLTLEIINIFQTMFPRMIMLWAQHKAATFEKLHQYPEVPPIKFLKALETYIIDETKQGRLAAADPLVTARTLLGASVHYVFWDTVGLNQHVPLDAKSYAESVVNTLWQGIKPRARRTEKKRRTRR